jgi:hypothetical protein
MAEQKWHQRYAEGIVIGVLTATVLSVVGYLEHIASPWFGPIFYGAIVAGIVFLCCLGFVIVRRTPRPTMIPSTKNIEFCVRTWLDNFRVMVKNDPYDGAYFRFRITLDSGKIMTITRYRSVYPDYVTIDADLGIRGEDGKKILELFNTEERQAIISDIHLELARAKMSYSGLIDPPENFQIFRRVPIYPTLTEFAFMAMIGDVEAAMNLVYVMFLKVKQKKDASSTLPSASDTPIPALPRA